MTRSTACLLFAIALFFPRLVQGQGVEKTNPADVSAAQVKANAGLSVKAELEGMLESDQRHRSQMSGTKDEKERASLSELQRQIDKVNQARLDEILKEYGWPSEAKFGRVGALAAFLVVQHSPPEKLKQHFPMLESAMKQGAIRKESFALIADRVRMYDGLPQLYGSQINRHPETGKLSVWQIEDEPNLDARRASMGLGPMAEYVKRFKGLEYAPPASESSKNTTSDAIQLKK